MKVERIEKDQCAAFLANFDKTHHGDEACLEIVGRECGDQMLTTWLPFSGVSYDTHADQLIITVGGTRSCSLAHLTHMIDQATQLLVLRAGGGNVCSLLMVAPDTTETFVHLRHPPQCVVV